MPSDRAPHPPYEPYTPYELPDPGGPEDGPDGSTGPERPGPYDQDPYDRQDPYGSCDPYELADPDRTLAALEAAGFPVAGMPEEQRAVLGALTAAETDVLLGIKLRLDEAEPEVRAHEAGLVGGLFF